MINITAYDTTACSGYRYPQILEQLEKAEVMGGLARYEVQTSPHNPKFPLSLVQGGNASADAVSFFGHPVFLEGDKSSAENGPLLCLDVRNFGRYDPHQNQFRVRNSAEFTWAIQRAILNELWYHGKVEALRDISMIPTATYCAVISETIARRYFLDPAEQLTVAILAGYFYYSQFTDAAQFDEDSMHRTVANIARATSAPAEMCYKILKDLPIINHLSFFIDCIKARVGNVALENFDERTLYGVVCGTWFGNNSREIIAVGLEHPPTWVMIVAASLESATFKRSTLAKISSRFDRANAGHNLKSSMSALLGGSAAIPELVGYTD
jgi:hypothetical protein